MAVSQSLLCGAMFAGGLSGGRIPAADAGAGALINPATTELMTMAPIGSKSVAMTTSTLLHAVFPPVNNSSQLSVSEEARTKGMGPFGTIAALLRWSASAAHRGWAYVVATVLCRGCCTAQPVGDPAAIRAWRGRGLGTTRHRLATVLQRARPASDTSRRTARHARPAEVQFVAMSRSSARTVDLLPRGQRQRAQHHHVLGELVTGQALGGVLAKPPRQLRRRPARPRQTTATPTSPMTGSFRLTTATAATSGWSASTPSTSIG